MLQTIVITDQHQLWDCQGRFTVNICLRYNLKP